MPLMEVAGESERVSSSSGCQVETCQRNGGAEVGGEGLLADLQQQHRRRLIWRQQLLGSKPPAGREQGERAVDAGRRDERAGPGLERFLQLRGELLVRILYRDLLIMSGHLLADIFMRKPIGLLTLCIAILSKTTA